LGSGSSFKNQSQGLKELDFGLINNKYPQTHKKSRKITSITRPSDLIKESLKTQISSIDKT
jgi:hypothetical protein